MLSYNVKRNDRFFRSAITKGNQTKWILNNKFLKADTMGYESIAEVLATELEMATMGINFIDYSLCKIKENDIEYTGCVSDIFTKDGENIVSVDKIVNRWLGNSSIKENFYNKYSGIELLNNILSICSEVTNIDKVILKNHWSNIIKLDTIILNEDRHFNNISFLKDFNGTYSLCPIFDNGLSFLSDVRDYPLAEENLHSMVNKVKVKPFSENFNKQVSYFNDCDLLHIDVEKLNYRLANCIVDFKKVEFNRAKKILKSRLDLLKGVVWE